MNFTAKDVQALREKTGAGMMDCKKALTETDGDMDKAVDVLREKGLASAAKKAGRVAAEGVVVAYYDEANKVASMVEVNCETDFVAKNEKFVELANKIAVTVAEKNPADVDALLAMTLSGSDETVSDAVQELFLVIRENMKVRRFVRVEGTVASYIHGGGSVGVLVSFDTDAADKAEFKEMGRNVAMQIAAMSPEYLSKDCISDDELAKMKSITIDSSLNKPESLQSRFLRISSIRLSTISSSAMRILQLMRSRRTTSSSSTSFPIRQLRLLSSLQWQARLISLQTRSLQVQSTAV